MTTYRRRSYGNTASRVIAGVGALFALIIVVHVLLFLFGAEPGNSFVQFISSLANPLALFFPGLFDLTNNTLEVILNFGLAAVFWLVVTGFLARLVARY